MAAAFAALISLQNNLDLIQNHPRHYFSFELKQIQSLKETVTSLIDFMKSCDRSPGVRKEAAEALEGRIARAAEAAEDVVESHVVDQIRRGETRRSNTRSSRFLLDLQKVIEDMEYMRRKAMNVKVQSGTEATYSAAAATSSTSNKTTTTTTTTMVGFDGFFLQLLDKLTGVPLRRQVIPIVGMGGIGKTFLARNAFKDPLIVQHFDICLWATISQQYKVEKILSELVSGLRKFKSKTFDESTSYRTVDEGLDEELYKGLCGRRYLIILDDMWSVEAWYDIRSLFPDKDDGSRIVVTTRHSYVASHLNISWLEIRILNEDNSWNLFCQKAFAEKGCPPELEEIGKKIVGKCRGLPLAIVVAGGHLRNSSMAPQYWENVANHMDSILNSTENEEQCLDVLSLSYSYMPPHLKPCFLLLGVFHVLDSTRAINQERRVVISGEKVAEANHQTRTFDAPIRFLVYDGGWPPCDLPSSISRLWNLQILEIHLDPNWSSVIAPYEIWEMLQLRHLEITSIYLLDPIPGKVLHHLPRLMQPGLV